MLACHQIGAAVVVGLAGVARDALGDYDLAWYVAGGLCAVAVLLCLALRTPGRGRTARSRPWAELDRAGRRSVVRGG